MVSCLFTKHLLTCGIETVDGTEKLCQPKCRALIAGHSISSTFFCTSAVCLLISQKINVKNSRSHFITVRLVEIAIFAYILVNKSTNNKIFEKVLLWQTLRLVSKYFKCLLEPLALIVLLGWRCWKKLSPTEGCRELYFCFKPDFYNLLKLQYVKS